MGLKVWLPLNGDLHNQGCSNVTITNNGATVNANGKIGSCYAFNGSSNYMYTSYNFYNSQYSVCAWIYTTTATATQTIVCDRKTVGYGFSIFLLNSGLLRLDPGCNNTNLQWTTSYSYPINTWFHLTVTYDGTDVAYYINGEFKEKIARSITNTYWGTTTSIGASQANGSGYGNYLNGRLNDVRIYDHCLSAAEAREISQGLVLHYKLDDMSSTTVEDSSGYNHNGTRAGTISTYTDSPRYSQCMNLSAAASRINCGRGGMVTDAITVNFWANLPTVPSALSDTTGFVSCAESGGFRIQIGNNALVRTIIYINSAYAVIEGSTAIQANTWYMITLVYDRMNSKLYEYINGIKDAELDVVNNKIIGYNSGNVLWIGAEARSGTSYYSAIAEKVSDFRIYCTALNADAIRQLYELGAKIDNKHTFHTFELVEDTSTIKITHRGQTKAIGTYDNNNHSYDGFDETSSSTTKFRKNNKKISAAQFIEI